MSCHERVSWLWPSAAYKTTFRRSSDRPNARSGLVRPSKKGADRRSFIGGSDARIIIGERPFLLLQLDQNRLIVDSLQI
jgi:hypothetical protein